MMQAFGYFCKFQQLNGILKVLPGVIFDQNVITSLFLLKLQLVSCSTILNIELN